ncbi:hypothetical protein J0X19_24290 [Hymenobacter sp. BT186]|uniref:DUF4476 domain-containing protein n=1 Tax=Hymenobacter telluris TaxID=2816474 RepID=A0A939F1J4_9BACT|nr:hypothetical protein [Hymenobacter telluris]MBO0361101.1 hypothetical protein [Hymenobacter telluris]MBW3377129.1 hypothetical protein [Hymenobacter norwichensis]
MKRTILPLLTMLSLTATAAFAQAGMNSYDMADITRGRPTSTRNLNKNTGDHAAAIASTPPLAYYNQGWNAGTVQQLDGQTGPVSGLRYNLGLQWLEVQDASVPNGIRVYPSGSLKSFTLVPGAGQVPHVFREYKYSSTRAGSGRGFMEELNRTGAIRLLVRHTFEERPAEINAALNTEVRPAQQLHVSTLFVVQPSKPDLATELTLDRRSVMRLFKSRAVELDDYAKSQPRILDYTNLNDVLQLVEHYNTLVADTPAK